MTQRIFYLPDDLASQIAAGEVVERPASVVKELLENSLDAGSTRVEVTISGGGIELIEVMDDGQGMSHADAPLALGRHATSKLSAFENLLALQTYGFRGEALPSIASVSRLSLRTRDKDSIAGLLLSAQGTTAPSSAPIGSPIGTTVRVEDLFFNVPARRKFLRSTNTESGHVTDVLVDAALSRPDVSFSLTRDGRRQKHFPRVSTRCERVEQVLSDEELRGFSGERGPLRVEAYLCGPERARRGASGLKLFVNERPIRDRALSGTVAHAFGELLERGRYPKGVVYLNLPCELVDVNVHPQKTEVRFEEPRAVADAVYQVLKRGLSPQGQDKTRGEDLESDAEKPTVLQQVALQVVSDGGARVGGNRYRIQPGTGTSFKGVRQNADFAPKAEARKSLSQAPSSAPESSSSRAPSSSAPSSPAPNSSQSRGRAEFRFVAQVKQAYLICESDAGLLILDQHAADEVRLFSELYGAFSRGQVPEQALLFPVTAELSLSQVKLCQKHSAEIGQLGIELRVRGERAVSVHAVPRALLRTPPEVILQDLVATLSGKRKKDVSLSEQVLARMACREALKGGERLSREDAESLVRNLRRPFCGAVCLHGDPVLSETAFSALARNASQEESSESMG